MAVSSVAPDLAREIAENRLAMAELAAEASALSIDTLDLENIRVRGQQATGDAVAWGRALSAALAAASCTRTIEGASTLVLTFDDPLIDMVDEQGNTVQRRALATSPLLDLRGDERLDSIAVDLDTLVFRLVKVEKQQDQLILTFEEEAVALLRQHTRHVAVSRNAMTRAEFIWRKLIREVTEVDLPYYSPEFLETQARDEPSQWSPTKRDATRQSGFAADAKIKIQGVLADPEQLNNLTIVMGVADVHQASDRARLAMICAGIGESVLRAIPNNDPNNTHEGVFQADRNVIPRKDTAQQARYFLLGGKGFGMGGAIQAARDHPDWSSGTIAYKVEGSRPNFASDQEAEHHYGQYHAEAQAILKAWRGDATTGGETTRTSVQQYQFTRGLAGKTETSWDAMQRLASEVNWRCFVVAGVVFYISEEWLFESRSRATLSEGDPGIDYVDFDWDLGKPVAEVTVQCRASRWSFPPGSVVAIENTGPADGRWLVHTIERANLFDNATTITLTKPIPRKPEPAATLVTRSAGKARSNAGGAGTYTLPVDRKYLHSEKDLGRTDDGVDIETAPDGADVFSMTDGIVTAIASNPTGFGPNYPVIQVTNGPLKDQYIYYGHVAQAVVKKGDAVTKGKRIAVMGHTGDASGMGHGHIEVGFSNASGVPVNQHGANPETEAGKRMRVVLINLIKQAWQQ